MICPSRPIECQRSEHTAQPWRSLFRLGNYSVNTTQNVGAMLGRQWTAYWTIPENKRHWASVGLMVTQRLCWPNIEPTLAQCLVFAEMSKLGEHEIFTQYWADVADGGTTLDTASVSRVCWYQTLACTLSVWMGINCKDVNIGLSILYSDSSGNIRELVN